MSRSTNRKKSVKKEKNVINKSELYQIQEKKIQNDTVNRNQYDDNAMFRIMSVISFISSVVSIFSQLFGNDSYVESVLVALIISLFIAYIMLEIKNSKRETLCGKICELYTWYKDNSVFVLVPLIVFFFIFVLLVMVKSK